MKWDEFRDLLVGIGPDTALGRIVAIRSEENEEILKNFTPEQKRVRDSWRLKKAKNLDQKIMDKILEGFKQMFIDLAGGVTN